MASISAKMDALDDLAEPDEGHRARFERLERAFTRAAAERLCLQDEVREEIVNAGRPGSRLKAIPGNPGGDDAYRPVAAASATTRTARLSAVTRPVCLAGAR